VSNAQCRLIDFQAQLQMSRLDAEWVDLLEGLEEALG
jgi:hypothetical protein